MRQWWCVWKVLVWVDVRIDWSKRRRRRVRVDKEARLGSVGQQQATHHSSRVLANKRGNEAFTPEKRTRSETPYRGCIACVWFFLYLSAGLNECPSLVFPLKTGHFMLFKVDSYCFFRSCIPLLQPFLLHPNNAIHSHFFPPPNTHWCLLLSLFQVITLNP